MKVALIEKYKQIKVVTPVVCGRVVDGIVGWCQFQRLVSVKQLDLRKPIQMNGNFHEDYGN